MRVFLLILIGIVAGSAAGSMTSWFLTKTPQPLAVATSNSNDVQAAPAPPPELDAEPKRTELAPDEIEPARKPVTQPDSLDRQALEMQQMRDREEKAQAASTPVEPPTVEPATPERKADAAPVNRPSRANAVPAAPPVPEGPGYVLPIGIGVITGIVAFLVANRLLSQDI